MSKWEKSELGRTPEKRAGDRHTRGQCCPHSHTRHLYTGAVYRPGCATPSPSSAPLLFGEFASGWTHWRGAWGRGVQAGRSPSRKRGAEPRIWDPEWYLLEGDRPWRRPGLEGGLRRELSLSEADPEKRAISGLHRTESSGRMVSHGPHPVTVTCPPEETLPAVT